MAPPAPGCPGARPLPDCLKILLLKPSSLGDVVQALPVLRLLKLRFPRAEIWWWIDAALAPLLADDRDLAGLVRFERRRWASPRRWPEMLRSLAWMRSRRFDWVIDLQGLARSGAFAWLANGGLLAGLDEAREGARGFYDVIVPRASFHTHAVDWYLSVLPRLGVPVHDVFDWLPERPAVADSVRAKWPAARDARWLVLLPGARWDNKRWPVAHFAALAQALSAAQPDLRFLILGSGDDRERGAHLAAAVPGRCLDLTGQTTLPEMVEWLRLCAGVVTNDTGPMHVAAALRKPVIALCGPTEPRRTGPYGQLDGVLQEPLPCVPCLKSRCRHAEPLACLHAIAPERVAQKVLARL